MRRLSASDYKIMPWKNGGGTTTEIAISPENAGLASFDWRISIAEIKAPGPFSRYPGYERTIMLIDGEGMVLDAGNSGRVALSRYVPQHFPGEWQVEAILEGGAVRDFNLMVKRGRIRGQLEALELRETIHLVAAPGDVLACTVLAGDLAEASKGDSLISGDGLSLSPAGSTPVTIALVRLSPSSS
jgi:environmental stress-induced protein Ves